MAHGHDLPELLDSDPSFYAGRPFVRGRRVTVQRLAILHNQGRTPEQIALDFGMDRHQVEAALAYYFANKEAMDLDVAQQDAEYRRLSASHPSVRDRLRVAR